MEPPPTPIAGVGFMEENVVEFRAQAKLCRQLAISEPKNRIFWLAEAERWSRHAQDEISYHYEECNVIHLRDAASHANVAV